MSQKKNFSFLGVFFWTVGRKAHPRWRMRMWRFIPTRDVSTLAQLGHKHLNAPLLEICHREETALSCYKHYSAFISTICSTLLCHHTHLAPPGLRLILWPRLHEQPLIHPLPHAAVCLGDGWWGSRTDAAVLPAPVSAAAAVWQFPPTTLHFQRAIWTSQTERLSRGVLFLYRSHKKSSYKPSEYEINVFFLSWRRWRTW